MQKSVDAKNEDIDGFTEFARSIKDVEISFMIQETSKNTFRINFRSSGIYVINDIAKSFGGGGHKFAAGAKVKNVNIEDLEKEIFDKVSSKIKEDYVD